MFYWSFKRRRVGTLGNRPETVIPNPKQVLEVATAKLENFAPFMALFNDWVNTLMKQMREFIENTPGGFNSHYLQKIKDGTVQIYQGLHGILGQAYVSKMEAAAQLHSSPKSAVLEDVI